MPNINEVDDSTRFDDVILEEDAKEDDESSTKSRSISTDLMEPKESWFRSWFPYLRWVPSSPEKLKRSEEKVIEFITTPSEGFYVNCGTINDQMCNVWTMKFTSKAKEKRSTPIVMLHGMGAGWALFAMNIDDLTKDADVYAIDLPGFARSSRPIFSTDPLEAEEQYVNCLEQWRKCLKLPKIILIGHSFGGYVTASYCLKYPKYLENIVLVDPWGVSAYSEEGNQRRNVPFWLKIILGMFNTFSWTPLVMLRFVGPAGPRAVERVRPDIKRRYESFVGQANVELISNYLYHCNAHYPSGEMLFTTLMKNFAWAKNPMLTRLKKKDSKVPMTVLYGANSWVTYISPEEFERNEVGNCTVHMVENASHHVYSDQPDVFYELVQQSLTPL